MVKFGNRAGKVLIGFLVFSCASLQGYLIYRANRGDPVGKN